MQSADSSVPEDCNVIALGHVVSAVAGGMTEMMALRRDGRSRSIQAAVLAACGIAFAVTGIVALLASQPTESGVGPPPLVSQSANGGAVEEHYHPGRPAHIHGGTCDELGEVEFPLNPVGAGTMTGVGMDGVTSMPIGERVGSPLATAMEASHITLEVPLTEIVAAERTLIVQISEFEYGSYIACGNVPEVKGLETLAFGLAERNGSGFSGMAVLQDNGSTTDVSVYLAQGLGDALDKEADT